MFHCAVLMPTDHKEKKQTYKKRHIGNDNVNVFLSENDYDYDPQTICSSSTLPLLVCWTAILSDRAARALMTAPANSSRVFQNADNELMPQKETDSK